MSETKGVSIKELSGKNINFLVGAGMSAGYIPTLWIEEEEKSLEEIFTVLENNGQKDTMEFFAYQLYYWNNILTKGYLDEKDSEQYKNLLEEYKKFEKKCVDFLYLQNEDYSSKINIFTTNYDLFFEKAADELLEDGEKFILNDGSNGFIKKSYNVTNYDKEVYTTGIFRNNYSMIPTINLYKIHGSLSWKKEKEIIRVDYENTNKNLNKINYRYQNGTHSIDESSIQNNEEIGTQNQEIKNASNEYKDLQIINPTKKKFETTILDENYFHQIRSFTYELEKENSVLIVFGFSFADEHIREIVKRSIKNPNLQVFIYVYTENEYQKTFVTNNSNKFLTECLNVKFILPEDNGSQDIKIFCDKIFIKSEA